MIKKSPIIPLILTLFVVLSYIGFGIKNHVVYFFDNVWHDVPTSNNQEKLTFSFTDKSDLFSNYIPSNGIANQEFPNAVFIADYNYDGFEDVLFLNTVYENGSIRTHFILLNNKHGIGFENNLGVIDLEDLAGGEFVNGAGVADLNNDHFPDVVMNLNSKKILIALGTGTGFKVVKKIDYPFLNGDGRNIIFVDYNRDGFLDVFLSSYHNDVPNSRHMRWVNDESCNSVQILQNDKGVSFDYVSSNVINTKKICNYAFMSSDLNNDGFSDLFLASRYNVNQLFKNNKGEKFINATNSLGFQRSGFPMGIDAADIFSEGIQSVYTSNSNANILYKYGANSLFWNQTSGGDGDLKFTDIARSTGTDNCHYSWGVRFLDPDRNGYPDLFVTKSQFMSSNRLNYLTIAHWAMASGLFSDNVFIEESMSKQEMKPCFFVNKGKAEMWDNVADELPIAIPIGSLVIAGFDFNNDGQEDLVIKNKRGNTYLYSGKYFGENHWLGIKLIATKSNSDAIGTKLLLKTSKRVHLKEITLGGSYQSQSSKNAIFGITKEEAAAKLTLTISWPSGLKQEIEIKNLDQYLVLREE